MARAAAHGDRRAWFVAEWHTAGAEAAVEPVGLVLGRRRPPDTAMLFSMWVDPAARGRGVGSLLLDAVADWGSGWGAREVVLWVFESNAAAIRLYERVGYERIEQGPDAESGRSWNALAMRQRIAEGEPGG